MRKQVSRITALSLACTGLLLAAAPAFAQSSSFGSNSNTSSFGTGNSTSSFGSNSTSNSSSTSFLNSNGSSNSTFGSNTSTGGTNTGTGGTSANSKTPGATSFLGQSYANPLAMGLGSNTSITSNGPAFGSPLYNINTTTTKSTASQTNAQQNNNQASGVGIRRLPAYAATVRIKDMPPGPTAAAVQLDLQNMLGQAPQLDSRDSVRVSIDGQAVVLKGHVVDDDERRLVENMVRLTPGVGPIRNELEPRMASK